MFFNNHSTFWEISENHLQFSLVLEDIITNLLETNETN